MATKKTKTKKAKPAPKRTGKPFKRTARRAAAPIEPRKLTCRKCKAKIEFTTGLDEMARHWEDEHPDDLSRLRRKLDSTSRWNHEPEA